MGEKRRAPNFPRGLGAEKGTTIDERRLVSSLHRSMSRKTAPLAPMLHQKERQMGNEGACSTLAIVSTGSGMVDANCGTRGKTGRLGMCNGLGWAGSGLNSLGQSPTAYQ